MPAEYRGTNQQDAAIAAIVFAWDGVCVYDTLSPNTGNDLLVVGHKGSEYLFSLVDERGHRFDVTDTLSQSHWLEDIVSGRLPLVWSPKDSRQQDEIDSYHPSRGDYLAEPGF